MAKTGLSLSIPKGPSNWTSWMKSVPTSPSFKDKSMVSGAFLVPISAWTCALACKAETNSCQWSWATVIPAAWAWPPNWARCSLISVNQSKRWTASVERPLPLYWPLSAWYWKIRAGRWYCSLKRPATIPTTPAGQLGSDSIIIWGMGPCPSLWLTWSIILATRSLRSWFFSLIKANSSWASSSSWVLSSSKAGVGSPNRPIALSRGPMVKPIVSAVIFSISTCSSSSSNRKPMRMVSRMSWRPLRTRVRFSSRRETTSLTVPMAANSTNSVGTSPNKAVANFRATPAPLKSGKG